MNTIKKSTEALNAKLVASEVRVKELMEIEAQRVPQDSAELDALTDEKARLEERLKSAEDEKGTREAGMKTLVTRFQAGETLVRGAKNQDSWPLTQHTPCPARPGECSRS